MSFASDILKGYWTVQAVWKKVCFSVSESSLYGEGPSIFEKATTANQIRGTKRNIRTLLKFKIIIFFYTFEEILAEFIVDKYYLFFYVNLKPAFCHYPLKILFLILLQLCWNTTALQHIEYVHLNSPIFLCGAAAFVNYCFHLLLWGYWGFLTSFYQWF